MVEKYATCALDNNNCGVTADGLLGLSSYPSTNFLQPVVVRSDIAINTDIIFFIIFSFKN
jgi:hypothetical protein